MTDSADVHVNVGAFADAPHELLAAAVRRTLEDAGTGGEISLTLLSDDEITELNREYLGHDRPTDVIAFSLGEDDAVLGDVYLGVETAERHSGELGVPLEEELVRLAIHGTLHVLGHEHPEGSERAQSPMYVLQERLLRELLPAAGPK